MARLLPYENYTLVSPLSRDQLLLKLLENTLTAEQYVNEVDKRVFSFGLKGWSKPYWGYIRLGSFEIKRLLNYHNFGNPKIFGLILPGENGTTIKIKIRPDGFALLFVGLCLIGFLYGFIDSIIESIKTNETHIGVLVAGGLTFFTYLLLLVAFKMEAVRSKEFLSNLLKVDACVHEPSTETLVSK